MSWTTQDIRGEDSLVRLDRASGTLAVRRYRLSVIAGPDAGKAVPLTSRLVVGAHPTAGLQVVDPTVSRFHLELDPRADGVKVKDLDSRNGTYLSGARVQEVIVEGEAVVSAGNTKLRISIEEERLDRPSARSSFGTAIAADPKMQELFGMLERVAATDSTVVLLGETGTGKDVLARALHRESPRRERPFVVVDCGAVSPHLIESELFGHVKGAFTGALEDRPGLFLQAAGGTVFLDEIGELPLELQPKLLRALETRTVRRVGEDRPRRLDVRVVAATHRDLEAEVKAGRFREDLFYRLAVVVLKVPPLRERREDIPFLARHFAAQLGDPDFAFPQALLERFATHAWPGNVRELRNAVERTIIGTGEHEPFPLLPAPRAANDREEQRRRIVDALERCAGNQTEAAKLLGVSRRTLQVWLDAHGIPRPRKGLAGKR